MLRGAQNISALQDINCNIPCASCCSGLAALISSPPWEPQNSLDHWQHCFGWKTGEMKYGNLEECTEMAQDRVQWRALLLAVLNIGVLLPESTRWFGGYGKYHVERNAGRPAVSHRGNTGHETSTATIKTDNSLLLDPTIWYLFLTSCSQNTQQSFPRKKQR
jgi:hypothetical protein